MYIPGISSNNILGGSLTSGFLTVIDAMLQAWQARVGVGGSNADLRWGVWSPTLGDLPLTPPRHPVTGYNLTAGFHDIDHAITDTIAGTQRRRGV
jgi:hypothetical protein